MTRYKIVITKDTVNDLKRYLSYIKYNLKNKHALKNVRDDFDLTSASLSKTAGAIPDPESPKLISRGLKRINFKQHDYFILFRIRDDTVEVVQMFHASEDFENKLR